VVSRQRSVDCAAGTVVGALFVGCLFGVWVLLPVPCMLLGCVVPRRVRECVEHLNVLNFSVLSVLECCVVALCISFLCCLCVCVLHLLLLYLGVCVSVCLS
jgi:hypothetical protein